MLLAYIPGPGGIEYDIGRKSICLISPRGTLGHSGRQKSITNISSVQQ